jgi:hypothetical protein
VTTDDFAVAQLRMLPSRAAAARRLALRHAHAAAAPLLAALRAATHPLPVRGADVDVLSSPADFAQAWRGCAVLF